MNTVSKFDLQQITRLPLVEIVNPNASGNILIVRTPHKGSVNIEYKEETGFFTRSLKDKLFGKVIQEIRELEIEAKDYLLERWLKGE